MDRSTTTRSVGAAVAGLALLVGALAAIAWALPHTSTARALYLFERETPTEIQAGSAQQGAGLLGLDVVTLDDGRVVEVYRQGEARRQWPRPEYLVGERGARLADEPASAGAWVPFGWRAGLGWLLGLAGLVVGLTLLVPRLPGALRRTGFVVFGQRDPDSEAVVFIPGAGTHGGAGGQVPPLVPYNPDWDPENRIP